MLKHLQKSVEEEELVWKSKMANSEEQLKLVRHDVLLKSLSYMMLILFYRVCTPLRPFHNLTTVSYLQALEKVSKLEAENQSVEQVRVFVS